MIALLAVIVACNLVTLVFACLNFRIARRLHHRAAEHLVALDAVHQTAQRAVHGAGGPVK